MLFAFRGIRMFQVLLAIIALACGVGATVALKRVADGQGILLLLPAVLLGMVFLWAFAATLRAPTSFVAVTPERTRIRFAGLIDTVISNKDVAGARLVRRNILGGIGVRTNFSGDVALVSTWGEVTVEGHYVGRLDALTFKPDPRAGGREAQAVRGAAIRPVCPMRRRAHGR